MLGHEKKENESQPQFEYPKQIREFREKRLLHFVFVVLQVVLYCICVFVWTRCRGCYPVVTGAFCCCCCWISRKCFRTIGSVTYERAPNKHHVPCSVIFMTSRFIFRPQHWNGSRKALPSTHKHIGRRIFDGPNVINAHTKWTKREQNIS